MVRSCSRSTSGIYATPLFSCTYTSRRRWWWCWGVLVNHALTVGLGQLRQAVVLLVRDEVGQPSEEAAAQLTLEDGVHLPEQHVLQLAGACQEGKEREERSERASERVSAVPGARAAKVFFLWPPSDV